MKYRIIFGVILVGGVLILHTSHSDTLLPDWWMLLNIIPILFGYAAEMGLHQSAQAGLYVGLVIQWSMIGILFGDLYLKYAGSRRHG